MKEIELMTAFGLQQLLGVTFPERTIAINKCTINAVEASGAIRGALEASVSGEGESFTVRGLFRIMSCGGVRAYLRVI